LTLNLTPVIDKCQKGIGLRCRGEIINDIIIYMTGVKYYYFLFPIVLLSVIQINLRVCEIRHETRPLRGAVIIVAVNDPVNCPPSHLYKNDDIPVSSYANPGTVVDTGEFVTPSPSPPPEGTN